jgi:hypothetical protein
VVYSYNEFSLEKEGNSNGGKGAYACNPNYSGGRDQEDLGSKPAWANNSQDTISKNSSQKKGWWSGSRYKALSSSPTTEKKEGNSST